MASSYKCENFDLRRDYWYLRKYMSYTTDDRQPLLLKVAFPKFIEVFQ